MEDTCLPISSAVPAQAIPNGPGTVLTFTVPSGTTLGKPLLVLRLNFTGGQSNGNDLQTIVDKYPDKWHDRS